MNGAELHNYIVYHSTSPVASNRIATDALASLQKENEQLRQENARLQNEVFQYQRRSNPASSEFVPAPLPQKKSPLGLILLFLVLAALIGFLAYTVLKSGSTDDPITSQDTSSSQAIKPRIVIGQYKVQSPRAYFHNEPDQAARRGAYLIPSNDVIAALDEQNGFIYTEFTNNKGQTSKGWIRKSDLIMLDEWNRRDSAQQAVRLKQEDINAQLQEARNFLAGGQVREALYIYDYLTQQGVPEAMYQWGNLALQRKNDNISCNEGWGWIQRASDKGYVPAKRTLGFLYLFADNEEVLQINEYDKCQYERNVFKGSKLLAEAMLAGDTTARRLLDELNMQREDSSGVGQ